MISEPPKVFVDRPQGRVSDSLYNAKIPPLASFETPNSSQETVKSNLESSGENVCDKLVTSVVTKPKNSETVTSSKSGSGIKLKIFKSRNVASCSQETYSSTVELPSDDSHAGSTSTSVASSPSTKDFSEENRDSSEELAPSGSPLTEYKDSQVTLPSIVSKATNYHPPDRLDSPNRTLNSTLDSSFEFVGLMDQRTGLPVDMYIDDSFSFSGNKSNSQTPHCSVKTYSSKCSKPDALNKCMSKNMVTSSSDIDTRQNALSDQVCDGPLTDDFDIFGVGSSDIGEPQKSSPVGRGVSPGVSSGAGDVESDSIDLFSTDFDENEIEDRTTIECSASSSLDLKDPAAMADTQEMEDLLFSSQGSLISSQISTSSSYESYKPDQLSKPESESAKKPEQPPLVKKRSIFKSRDADRDAKKRATYRHKWHDQEEKDDSSKQPPPPLPSSQSTSAATSPFDEFESPALKRVHTWPGSSTGDLDDSTESQSITSVKCLKGVKQVRLCDIHFSVCFVICCLFLYS